MIENKGFQRVHEFLLQDQSARLLPKERVCNCLKKRIDSSKEFSVKYNEVRNKAHWANVQRCGSVWTCPVCAKQITEKRRDELKRACDAWKNQGGEVFLLTLTNSHSANHALKSLISGQKKALRLFFGGRKAVELFTKLGRKYQIRSFEVTYGQNGWHPHFHILLFLDGSFDRSFNIRDDLAKHWINCCIKSGLPAPSMEHGLDLRDGKYADRYVSKWGIEHELTKGHIKKGRNGGFTPFDLLQLSIDDEIVYGRSTSRLYQEFAISFKGARQLVWSRGLKAYLGIDEKSDEELAEETELNAIELRTVDSFIFSLLCKYQKRHEFLKTLERDYENGCFGSGETEQMLVDLIEREIRFLEKGGTVFSSV
ncbi:rolling circle replication protein, Rep63 protein [Acinetobacter baumannii]|nr:rolling circle replication protein, Rep63 protein [Acinetobacter baumannii]